MDAAGDDPSFGAAGMQKSPSSDIDTDVIDLSSVSGACIEKDEITVFECFDGDGFAASGLVGCRSGEPEIHCGKAVVDESGAVETIGPLSCIAVGVSVCRAEYSLERSAGGVGILDDGPVAFCRAA